MSHVDRRSALVLGLFIAAAQGCGAGGSPFDEVDPASIPERPTYTEDVAPRIDYYCVACHAGGGNERDEDRALDTYEGVHDTFGEIERTAFVKRSMPPGAAPRMPARDWAILKRWQAVGFPR